MKNIAIITPEYPPFRNLGGIATSIYHLANILSKQNYHVHVITYDGIGDCKKTVQMNNITIHKIPYRTSIKLINFLYYKFLFGVVRDFLNKHNHQYLIQTIDWNIFSFLAFRQLHKQYHFKIIHSASFAYPVLIGLAMRRLIPCVIHIQSTQDMLNKYERPDIDHRLQIWIENFSIRHLSTRIITCTQLTKQIMKSRYPHLKSRISCIHCFFDVDTYSNNKTIDIHNLVFMGRLDYRKGADILLDAFVKLAKKHPQLKLWLIGENTESFPTHNRFIDFYTLFDKKKIPSNIKKRIYILPRIDYRNSLIEILKIIKGIGIFPSRHETFGYVVIEAMALGYIVIASANGGGAEIVDHSVNGFLTQPTVSSICKNIELAIQLSAIERERMSSNAVEKVYKHFDYRIARKKYRKLYDEIKESAN